MPHNKPSSSATKVKRLKNACRTHGDLRTAWRVAFGYSIAETARKIGASRTDINLLFSPEPGRNYPHWRRALEREFGLEPYSLDPVIDEAKRC